MCELNIDKERNMLVCLRAHNTHMMAFLVFYGLGNTKAHTHTHKSNIYERDADILQNLQTGLNYPCSI